jgi:hypothetical protein
MTKRNLPWGVCVLAVGLGLALPEAALAQPGKRGPDARAAKQAKLRQKLRAARAWKLTEELDLDEATAGKLFPVLNQFDDKFVKVMEHGAALRRELRKELDGGAARDARINEIINAMLENQRALWKLGEERFLAIRKHLSPAQAAKALVLLPEIDRAVQREIRKVMRRHRGEPFGGPHDAEEDSPF